MPKVLSSQKEFNVIDYEIARFITLLVPVCIYLLGIITGVLIDRSYWKPRIYRYADREIVKTLEYQKNKIEKFKADLAVSNSAVSELRGIIRISKIAATRILTATKE